MSERTYTGRIRLRGISAEAFVKDTDRIALRNLQRVPLLPLLVRKFNEGSFDRLFHAWNSGQSVRCGPRQFATLYNLMREACDILQVPEPDLYVQYSPTYNAMTAGVGRPFIILHSALVNDFTDEELLYVIGHELGHIKCEHVLYQMLARFLIQLLRGIAPFTGPVGLWMNVGLLSAFLEWLRQAELSADRAGLLVCQSPRVALSATMKLGCGGTRFSTEMDLDTYLEQAREHDEERTEGLGAMLLYLLISSMLDHPQTVYRARELDAWVRNGEYQKILAGSYKRTAEAEGEGGVQCARCGRRTLVGVPFCPGCGATLDGSPPPEDFEEGI